ncbi:MAG: DUF4360 domain-containing protein [Myxococcales bacterium]|nr:DUF4360 domain-containing protein [Myxococcales bacterium]
MKIFSILACTALISTSAFANDYLSLDIVPSDDPAMVPVTIEGFAFNGTGCSEDSVSALLTDDKQSLSILLDDMIADTSTKRVDRKTCNVALSLKVPQGLTVSILGYDYRGFALVPDKRGAQGVYQTEYFFAGQLGVISRERFGPGFADLWTIEDDITLISSIWSPCGRDVNVRSNTSITGIGDGVYMTLDSIDVTTAVKYQLQWRRCKE